MDILRGGWAPGLLGNGAGLRADSPSTGGSYQAETDAIAAAFTTPPTTARKDLIDAAVVALKTGGVWTKLDCMYVLAAADSQAAKINWKTPGTFNLTEVNSPTFAADLGFTGDAGGTKYLDSGWDPPTNGVTFTQNSASLHAWCNTDLRLDGGIIIGVNGVSSVSYINPWNSSVSTIGHGLNDGAFNALGPPANTLGLFSVSRTGSADYTVSRNAVSFGTQTAASVATVASDFRILNVVSAGNSRQISAGVWGGGLNSTEITALYNALAAYMAGLATDRIAAAFTTPPSAARKTLIQNCVTSLMQGGVWDKLDALYAFAAADSQASLINWKNPGTFNATNVNTVAFVADRGYTSSSTAMYLDSGFNPTTAPTPNFVQNSASAFGWSNTDAQALGALVGNGNDTLFVISRGAADAINLAVNSSAFLSGTGPAAGLGLWSGSRDSSTALAYYRNGAALTMTGNPVASSAPHNSSIVFTKRPSNFWGGQLSGGGFGSALNSTEQTALYNALRTYMTGVGVP